MTQISTEPQVEPTQAPVAEDLPVTVIEPRRGWIGIDWRELVGHRELLYFMVWRDVKVRYTQTVLGVVWAVLQPVLTMVIFTVIFGKLVKVPSDGYPYAVFVYAGLLPWTFFSNSLGQGGLSLVNQQGLLTKIYFPRLFVPTSSVGAAMVDFAISFAIYAVVLAVYGIVPGVGIVFLPLLVVLTVMATLGFVYSLSALTVTYRDFRYIIPFMVQVMMYLSPVIYPVSIFPKEYQWVLALNPMAGIIDGYRSAILGKEWNFTTLGVSSAVTVLLFFYGLFYFRKTERRFADIA